MAVDVAATMNRAGQEFLSWPMQRRIGAVGSVAAGILLFAILISWAMRMTYAPLMTGLSEEDTAQVVERLQSENVPYELGANGTSILVPESQVHEIRLKLASEGLPKGGSVGFELFDSPSFGMSRFAEQLNFRRGLEGELRRSIKQINAVKDARVHIVVPQEGLFREQDRQATAAVTLHLRPGRALGAGQVQAIVHLVASSVAGLTPEKVTVVDSQGVILAKGGEAEGDMSGALEKQHAVEKSVEERVVSILSPIVGAGHVVVRASAMLDFSRMDKTQETFDPASQVVRSEQISQERRSQAGGASGGVAGAHSNLTGIDKEGSGTSSSASGPTSGGERSSATHNYELSKTISHEVGPHGRLARLSVAVLVNGVDTVDADGKHTIKERPQEELVRFGELVRRAMGFDADRDDQVVVQSMPFEQEPALEPLVEQPKWMGLVERFWPPVLALLAGIVLSVVFLRRAKIASQEAPQNYRPKTVREMEEELLGSQGLAGMTAAAAQAAVAQGQPNAQGYGIGMRPAPRVGASLSTTLEPQHAADVIKGWLAEP